jgi:hypothetical protein
MSSRAVRSDHQAGAAMADQTRRPRDVHPATTTWPLLEIEVSAPPDLFHTGRNCAGRGGLIERMTVVRGTSQLRYAREGFADATSAAVLPTEAAAWATSANLAAVSDPIRRAPARPWPAMSSWPRRAAATWSWRRTRWARIMATTAILDGVIVIRTLGHVWGIGERRP